MKNINETFTDEEYLEIKNVKGKTGKNWHDFILGIARERPKEAEDLKTATVGQSGMASIGRPYAGKIVQWKVKD